MKIKTIVRYHLTLVISRRFTELHGEEKREEGDRGDQEEKRENQKERERSSQ